MFEKGKIGHDGATDIACLAPHVLSTPPWMEVGEGVRVCKHVLHCAVVAVVRRAVGTHKRNVCEAKVRAVVSINGVSADTNARQTWNKTNQIDEDRR